MPIDVREFIGQNPYPGRVIGFRSTQPGQLESVIMLTGRSPASKARVLDPARQGTTMLRARATTADPHDELRHYPAVVADSTGIVIANGDHSVPLHASLGDRTLDDQIAATRYEPDPPTNTSRLAVTFDRLAGRIVASINAATSTDDQAEPMLVRLESTTGSIGDWIMMSTYQSDGGTIEPNYHFTRIEFGTTDPLAELWDATDPRFRVAAAAVLFDNGTTTVRTVAPAAVG
ncbi:IMP cyclohydrolase [Nocardia sp. NPDC058058]|uniref:IMP cyclohydrolase n=1 Tax=Nocardia sp. NPDC058058 TaxID=3346317 RepID=UPI0036DEA9CE